MPNVKTWPENLDRFKELILYISQKCAADPAFDTIKLNKLMFFADFMSYGISGEPITGFQYEKLEHGPAPKRMPDVKKQMVHESSLGLQEIQLRPWHRPVNLRAPKLNVFNADQIALVDRLIELFRSVDGDQLSEASHQFPCWIIPDLRDTIPYEMVFLSNEPVTPVDVERGQAISRELGFGEQSAHA